MFQSPTHVPPIEGVVIHPGDAVILRLTRGADPQALSDALREWIPEGVRGS